MPDVKFGENPATQSGDTECLTLTNKIAEFPLIWIHYHGGTLPIIKPRGVKIFVGLSVSSILQPQDLSTTGDRHPCSSHHASISARYGNKQR